jgi:hypothetical protein
MSPLLAKSSGSICHALRIYRSPNHVFSPLFLSETYCHPGICRPTNFTRNVLIPKYLHTSTYAVLGSIFLQTCSCLVLQVLPSFFLYMHRVSYVNLLHRTETQEIRHWCHVCWATQPRKCTFSMYIQREERYVICFWMALTHTSWSAEKDNNGFTDHFRSAIFPSLSRPPARLEVSIKRKYKVDVANELRSHSK